MARVMRLRRPDATVDYLSAGTLGRRRRSLAAFSDAFTSYDHVFAQPIAWRHVGAEHLAALAERHPGHVKAPNIVFSAFHPDLVYVGGPGAPFVESPVGHYNSALALYGYLAGLSVEQTLRLFDGRLYERLGYLDLWDYASDTLLTLGREAGLDLAGPLARWTRRGLFMHSTNHPRLFVLVDLAGLLLERAGLAFTSFDLDSYLVDDLALQGMWPVYEPVARRYGVPGASVFQAQQRGREPRKPAVVYGLTAFVEGSYARYAAIPRGRLVSDRVESWLASDPVRALFRDQAG